MPGHSCSHLLSFPPGDLSLDLVFERPLCHRATKPALPPARSVAPLGANAAGAVIQNAENRALHHGRPCIKLDACIRSCLGALCHRAASSRHLLCRVAGAVRDRAPDDSPTVALRLGTIRMAQTNTPASPCGNSVYPMCTVCGVLRFSSY